MSSLRVALVVAICCWLLPRETLGGLVAINGPGRHWLADVRTGYAAFAGQATVAVDLGLDGTVDLTVDLTGGTEVFRSAAGRDHVALEIVTMRLAGEVPGLGLLTFDVGDGVGNHAADGPLSSQGASDEIADDPRRSVDVFDLFAEVRLGALRLHNVVPLRVTAVIDRLPPIGAEFHLVGPPVPFVDGNGTALLQIAAVSFVPTAVPSGPCFPEGADALMLAAARSDAALRCGARTRRRCLRRVARAHVRSGQLNPQCLPLLVP